MTLKEISPTSLIGVAKVFVILLCAVALLFDFASMAKVALVMSFLGNALSALGFVKSQDAVPPQPDGLERKD